MQEIVTRSQAIACGSTTYYTGKPCKWGHVAKRWVNARNCSACAASHTKTWQQTNPDKRQIIAHRSYRNNKDAAYTRVARWARLNPHKRLAVTAKAQAVLRCKSWSHDPIPANFDLESTIPFYAEARRLTELTGVEHEVDHIIPLARGGMHVASNLQVITAAANQAKGTRLTTSAN